MTKPPGVTRAVCTVVARRAAHVRYVLPDRTLFAGRTAYMDTTADVGAPIHNEKRGAGHDMERLSQV